MKISWKNNSHKFTDPEYAKYSKQAYKTQFFLTLIFLVALGIGEIIFDDNQRLSGSNAFMFVATTIFLLLSGFCLGAASAVESADKYQAKKDKKNNEIPTV